MKFCKGVRSKAMYSPADMVRLEIQKEKYGQVPCKDRAFYGKTSGPSDELLTSDEPVVGDVLGLGDSGFTCGVALDRNRICE